MFSHNAAAFHPVRVIVLAPSSLNLWGFQENLEFFMGLVNAVGQSSVVQSSVLEFEQQPNSWRPSVYSLSDWASRSEGHGSSTLCSHNKCESTPMRVHTTRRIQKAVAHSVHTLHLLRAYVIRQCPTNVYCANNEGLKEFGANNGGNMVSLLYCCLCMTCNAPHMTGVTLQCYLDQLLE